MAIVYFFYLKQKFSKQLADKIVHVDGQGEYDGKDPAVQRRKIETSLEFHGLLRALPG